MVKSPNRCGSKTLAVAAGFLCFALGSVFSVEATEVVDPVNESRYLVACPSQTDIYQGIFPEVDWKGFEERDIFILDITKTDVYVILRLNEISTPLLVSQDSAKEYRHMSNCEAKDKYVLIGKDGGVKRRWNGQIDVDDLFQAIDAMPMRQFEMKTRDVN